MQDLIIVKQLPKIEEHLKELSAEVGKKVEDAKSLICTEENVKTIKQVRADLNKEFKEVEQQRKAVKEQVLAPYMKKEQEVKEYFEAYKKENNIDFITYEQAKINITLTASMKSLKGQVEEFVDKVADDLKLIETQEHKTEMLVEYKNTLNVSNAITTVMNRIEAIKQEKEMQDKVIIQSNEKHEITKESYEQLENVFNKNKKTYTITFTVTDTSIRLKQLKDYLIREGYQYE